METRQLLIMLVIGVFLIGGIMSFNINFLIGNNVAVPSALMASYQQQQAVLGSINQTLSGTTQSSSLGAFGIAPTSATQSSGLLSPPTALQSFMGTFAVFGGILFSFIGYLTAIPAMIGSLTGTFTSIPILADVVIMISGLVITIVGINLIFDFVSYIGKFRL
jgi:hypothetical protein